MTDDSKRLGALPARGEGGLELLVDARGHLCPVPTLRLRRAVEFAAPGARIRLLTDDPLARIDVPHFAAARGVEVVDLATLGTTISILLRVPG